MRGIYTERNERLYFPHEPITEGEFEAQLLRSVNKLIPNYSVGNWKPIIRDTLGRAARPDLILVSRDYEDWYVVEVELAHHDVQRHVLPQLETLSRGIYDATLLPSIQRAIPNGDAEQLRDLIYRPPGRLCIVDSYTERIHFACRDQDFDLAVLEPFRSEDGQPALAINKMPVSLIQAQSVGVYPLSWAGYLGDKMTLALPQHFPPWHGALSVIDLAGQRKECRIHATDTRRIIIVDRENMPVGKPLRLITVDTEAHLVRLEIG